MVTVHGPCVESRGRRVVSTRVYSTCVEAIPQVLGCTYPLTGNNGSLNVGSTSEGPPIYFWPADILAK